MGVQQLVKKIMQCVLGLANAFFAFGSACLTRPYDCSFCFEVSVGSCLTLHLCVSRAIPDLTLYVRLFKCFIAMVGPYLTLHLCVGRAMRLTMPDLALYVFVQMLHCNGPAMPDSCFSSASFG